jgi:diguanylate cyclase (GGDEF)-like protein
MTDPTDTRDIGPRVGSPLWTYLTLVTLAGAVVFVLASIRLMNLEQLVVHPLPWVLVALVLFGDIWPVVTPGRSSTDAPRASVVFTFAALIAWGTPVAVVLAAVSATGVLLGKRWAPHRVAFNAAVVALSLYAAGWVLRGLDLRRPLLTNAKHQIILPKLHQWLPNGGDVWKILLAAAAYFLVNFLLISIAIAVHTRKPVWQTLRSRLPYQALTYAVLFAAAPLVAVVISTCTTVFLLLFGVPLLAFHVAATVSMQREHQAHHDELTGLANRALLMRTLAKTLEQAATSGATVGFLLLDLDRGLKEVNDTLGHAVGDRLLRLVAHRLTHSVRPGDLVARLGGDEFGVLLPAVKEATVPREVAARLRAAVAEPIRLEGMSFVIEVSIGIAMFPDDATADETLVQHADLAMYLAKQRRSGVERYVADLDRNSPARLALFGEMRRGLDRGELELHYQPKVFLSDGRPAGIEALVRWRHPERGVLTPADFIPIVQQSYLMREVTAFVIETSVAQAARWRESGLPVQVSLNVSGRDLLDTRLAELVDQSLSRNQLPPEALLLEIDERVLTSEPAHAVSTAEALADIGVGLSLDDFGTGYSSLLRLKRLPFGEIKVDSSFIGRMLESPDDEVVVKSILDLAAALGITSVAEGVESAAVAAALMSMGCVAGQGWHFARPMNVVSATAWLAEHFLRTESVSPQPVP